MVSSERLVRIYQISRRHLHTEDGSRVLSKVGYYANPHGVISRALKSSVLQWEPRISNVNLVNMCQLSLKQSDHMSLAVSRNL